MLRVLAMSAHHPRNASLNQVAILLLLDRSRSQTPTEDRKKVSDTCFDLPQYSSSSFIVMFSGRGGYLWCRWRRYLGRWRARSCVRRGRRGQWGRSHSHLNSMRTHESDIMTPQTACGRGQFCLPLVLLYFLVGPATRLMVIDESVTFCDNCLIGCA